MVTAHNDRFNKMFPIKENQIVRQRKSIKHRQLGNRKEVDLMRPTIEEGDVKFKYQNN